MNFRSTLVRPKSLRDLEAMTIEQLKNKIAFQMDFMLFSRKNREQTIENITQLAVDYAEQFKYDFAQNCKSDSRIG